MPVIRTTLRLYLYASMLTAWMFVFLCSARQAPAAALQMPIEMIGVPGMVQQATLSVPNFVTPGETITHLWLRIHSLNYPNKASVQIGTGSWIDLNNSSVLVESPGRQYGGIGGPMATISLKVPLPTNLVRPGNTVVRFRFNYTDGVSIGYRVLALNFLTSTGRQALPASAFSQEQPSQWSPPLRSTADINQGQVLWRTAALRQSSLPGAKMMQARCTDCHAQDGRDLKYFNYSNRAIIERAKFHGLTDVQGKQIASFIRTLNVANPGRPWNPPYQPGPGMDSRPLSHWAAGAGLEAVLNTDSETLPYLFPNGIDVSDVAVETTLNIRNIPIAFQLPDWNQWLPRIHPKDAFGTLFTQSLASKLYNGVGTATSAWNLRDRLLRIDKLTVADPTYVLRGTGFRADYQLWDNQVKQLWKNTYLDRPAQTLAYAEAQYGLRLWQLIKTWEMHQEFGLEDNAPSVFATGYASPRAWLTDSIWDAAPHTIVISNQLPVGVSPMAPNLDLGGWSTPFMYFSVSWFYLQLLLNDSQRQPVNHFDWKYFLERIDVLNWKMDLGYPSMLTIVFVKGMQSMARPEPQFGPNYAGGWQIGILSPFEYTHKGGWSKMDPAKRADVIQAVMDTWLTKSRSYAPSQYPHIAPVSFDMVVSDPTYIPSQLPAPTGKHFGRDFYRALGELGGYKVDTNRLVDWAITMWPLGAADWQKVRSTQ